MTSKTRQIRGQQYRVDELVDEVLQQVHDQKLDLTFAKQTLEMMGHTNPPETLVYKYAREKAILAQLQQRTGANFNSQIGKIDFNSRESAIDGVERYLWRRVHGMRSNWTKTNRGY